MNDLFLTYGCYVCCGGSAVGVGIRVEWKATRQSTSGIVPL
jgi:hypothetical protein